jgi:hypothetical protein
VTAPRDDLERDAILDPALGLLLERGPRRMRLAELARRPVSAL